MVIPEKQEQCTRQKDTVNIPSDPASKIDALENTDLLDM